LRGREHLTKRSVDPLPPILPWRLDPDLGVGHRDRAGDHPIPETRPRPVLDTQIHRLGEEDRFVQCCQIGRAARPQAEEHRQQHVPAEVHHNLGQRNLTGTHRHLENVADVSHRIPSPSARFPAKA
jgi:hypothetical protein